MRDVCPECGHSNPRTHPDIITRFFEWLFRGDPRPSCSYVEIIQQGFADEQEPCECRDEWHPLK